MQPEELKRYFGKPVALLADYEDIPAGTYGMVSNVFVGAGMATLDIDWYLPEVVSEERGELYAKSAPRRTITFLGEISIELLERQHDAQP